MPWSCIDRVDRCVHGRSRHRSLSEENKSSDGQEPSQNPPLTADVGGDHYRASFEYDGTRVGQVEGARVAFETNLRAELASEQGGMYQGSGL